MLTIAYSGSLGSYDPKALKEKSGFLRTWFWTFNNDTVDSSTRSGYFLIQAIKVLRDKYQKSPNDIRVDWWGMIDPLNKKQVAEAQLNEYFTVNGYLPKQESLDRLAGADVLFLPLEKSKVSGQGTLFIPGKLYEYLKIGKPILALCEPSDCATILEQSGLGIFAAPDKPDEIASILLRIINKEINLQNINPDKNVIDSYSFYNKTEELANIFKVCLLRQSGKIH